MATKNEFFLNDKSNLLPLCGSDCIPATVSLLALCLGIDLRNKLIYIGNEFSPTRSKRYIITRISKDLLRSGGFVVARESMMVAQLEYRNNDTRRKDFL